MAQFYRQKHLIRTKSSMHFELINKNAAFVRLPRAWATEKLFD